MGERDTHTRSIPLRLVIFVCCAIFLIVDVLWLASEYPQNSRVGHAVAGMLGWERRPATSQSWLDLWIAHTPDGPEVAVSPQLLSESAKGAPSATFALWPPRESSGVWAPTRRGRVSAMYYEHLDGSQSTPLPPVELREPIRALIASTYQPWQLEKYDELLATGGVGTTPILSGYIHNAISLVAAITILVCSSSLVRTLVRQLRDARFPHGHCGQCGYDLSGLAVGSACPECGTSLRGKGK